MKPFNLPAGPVGHWIQSMNGLMNSQKPLCTEQKGMAWTRVLSLCPDGPTQRFKYLSNQSTKAPM